MLPFLQVTFITYLYNLLTGPLQDNISIARCEACAETIASILRTCGTATFLTESMTIWRCLHITLRLISFELPADSGHISIFDLFFRLSLQSPFRFFGPKRN